MSTLTPKSGNTTTTNGSSTTAPRSRNGRSSGDKTTRRKKSPNHKNGWQNIEGERPSYMVTPPSSASSYPPSIFSSESFDSQEHVNGTINKRKRNLGRKPVIIKTNGAGKRTRSWAASFLPQSQGALSIMMAVFLWYILGVLSIGTSKLLLTSDVPPTYLTLQQLFLGSNFLRFLMHQKAFGSAGLQPWPQPSQQSPVQRLQRRNDGKSSFWKTWHLKHLVLSGMFFALGFLATNWSFAAATAAFVETVKAAEPITSAGVAVLWGIEILGLPEVVSLLTIVAGVLLSTLANSASKDDDSSTSMQESLQACAIVMTANLCFSFRGLQQKLFRSSDVGRAGVVDDLNLQYRMQQVGVRLLVAPVLLWDMPGVVANIFVTGESQVWTLPMLCRFLLLSAVNGFAFTSYNLASTYVLTRISVVHHAALNCIRRIFAIIVTSILFGIPFTVLGVTGISLSLCGFLAFQHYKQRRKLQPKPISTLLPMSAV